MTANERIAVALNRGMPRIVESGVSNEPVTYTLQTRTENNYREVQED